MKYYNPNSERQRGGFNALSFFLLNKEEGAGWLGLALPGGVSPVNGIDLITFTALFIEQKIMHIDGSLGLKYQTMLMIIRAFAEYEKQFPGRDHGVWQNMDTPGNICSGNRKYAVLYTNERGTSSRVPSEIVFSIYKNHWTIAFNGPGGFVSPTEEDLSIRIEFLFNLFIMCASSMREYNAMNAYLLGIVGSRIVAHSAAKPNGTGLLLYIWEMYKWMSISKRNLNINISETTQLLVNYGIIRPVVEMNHEPGVSYSIMDNTWIFGDERFQKNKGSGSDASNFASVFGQISKGYTNLFSHNPIHKALYARKITPSDLVDEFALEMLKRTSAMKTLLDQNGFLLKSKDHKWTNDEATAIWVKMRDGILAGSEEIALDLANGKWESLDESIDEHLAPFGTLNDENYMTVALGISSFKEARSNPCTLSHLKFALTVILRWLHLAGIGSLETPLTNYTDEEFTEFLKKLEDVKFEMPEEEPEGLDGVVETMIVYGFFELAAKFNTAVTRKQVGFKRITKVPKTTRLTMGELLGLITTEGITVEL